MKKEFRKINFLPLSVNSHQTLQCIDNRKLGEKSTKLDSEGRANWFGLTWNSFVSG